MFIKMKNGCKAIANGIDIYLLEQDEVSYSSSVKLYSTPANSWKTLPLQKVEKLDYCVCSFMQKMFVIGGRGNSGRYHSSCMFYDKQSNFWTSMAALMEGREKAACTVFEGKIVVSGGIVKTSRDPNRNPFFRTQVITYTNSVEAYDYHEDKWSSFPRMLSARINHTAFSISNKMFMIGGSSNNSEVFDSVTRKFTFIKSLLKVIKYLDPNKTVCVGYNIYFFRGEENKEVKVHSFNVNKNNFILKTLLKLENTERFCCTKVVMF